MNEFNREIEEWKNVQRNEIKNISCEIINKIILNFTLKYSFSNNISKS